MSRNHFQIKELTAEHLEQYNALLRYAFQVTEKTLEESGWDDAVSYTHLPQVAAGTAGRAGSNAYFR